MKAPVIALALALSTSGAVLAADAPPTPPLAAFTWSGFYAGGYLGGGWTGTVNTPDATNPAPVTGVVSYPPGVPITCDDGTAGLKTGCVARYGVNPSIMGGATAGYNWQFGKTVAGLEGELGYLRLSGTGLMPYQVGTPCGSTSNPCSTSTSTSVGNVYGGFATRLGLTGDAFIPAWSSADHTLFFVKAGPAVTQMATSERCLASATGACAKAVTFSGSRNIWGADLGAGVEWALDQHWTVEAEYDYLTFRGPATACGILSLGVSGENGTWCTKTGLDDAQTARVGINYHF